MARKLFAAVALAAAVLASGSAAGQSVLIPEGDEITFRFLPGAFYNGTSTTVYVTIGCELMTSDPYLFGRNSNVNLHLKIVEPSADGSYATNGPTVIYSTRRGATGTAVLNGSQPCNLMRGVDTVEFGPIAAPAGKTFTREYLASLRVIARFYRGGRFPALQHEGMHYTGRFFWTNYRDHVHDGPSRSSLLAGEEYDDF